MITSSRCSLLIDRVLISSIALHGCLRVWTGNGCEEPSLPVSWLCTEILFSVLESHPQALPAGNTSAGHDLLIMPL